MASTAFTITTRFSGRAFLAATCLIPVRKASFTGVLPGASASGIFFPSIIEIRTSLEIRTTMFSNPSSSHAGASVNGSRSTCRHREKGPGAKMSRCQPRVQTHRKP